MYIIPETAREINNSIRNSALEMARRGFHLLPLKPQSKKPYSELLPGKSWNVFRENRASVATVESWLKYDPDINIGIITGVEIEPGYSLIVADFDTKPKFGLPITPIAETSRGLHSYFKCRTDRLPEAHKGGRGEIKTSGYVVAPPSLHPSGIRYKWAKYLSFVDVDIADFETREEQIISWLDPGKVTTHSPPDKDREELNTTININSSVLIQNLSISDDVEKNKSQLVALSKDESAAKEIFKQVFDVDVKKIGKTFCCCLHKEKNPSSALYRTDSGVIGVKDFHRAANFYTLPEYYFEYKAGKAKNLKGATSLIWWIRLLKDARILNLPRIIAPRPANKLPRTQKKLYLSFIELLEVQQGYDPTQKSAPFSHRFAADWSGLNYEAVRSAKRALSKKKYIKKVEAGDRKTRKAGKWALVNEK